MVASFCVLAASLVAAQSPDVTIVPVNHGQVVSSTANGCSGCCSGGGEWTGSSGGGLFNHGGGGGLFSGLRCRLQGLFNRGHGHGQYQASGCCDGCGAGVLGGMGGTVSVAPMAGAPVHEPPLANQPPAKAMPSGPAQPSQSPPPMPEPGPSPIPPNAVGVTLPPIQQSDLPR